jgi:pimeloyl-ACP methyl ester carboxylesterase/DNA-binding CsgD family transcriptional regulator
MFRWYSALSRDAMLVRYDGRGTGLSDRRADDFSLEAHVRDLEAVVDQLGLEKFYLFSVFNSGLVGLRYAAQHPERVAGLALWCAYSSGKEYFASPQVSAIRALIGNWELYTETGAHAFVGWSAGDAAHKLALLMRESVTHEVALQLLSVYMEEDCGDALASITSPTLVLHPRSFPLIEIDVARRIAAGIPNALFRAVEGDSLAPTLGNTDSILSALAEFMSQDGTAPSQPPPELVAAGPAVPSGVFTGRELEVLRLVTQGRSSRDIADALVLSPRTVEHHIANIYAKANVNNRAQITTYALTNGLI